MLFDSYPRTQLMLARDKFLILQSNNSLDKNATTRCTGQKAHNGQAAQLIAEVLKSKKQRQSDGRPTASSGSDHAMRGVW